MSKSKDHIKTVKTDKATIRFTGGVVDDDSSSEEEEFCDTRSTLSFTSDGKGSSNRVRNPSSDSSNLRTKRSSQSPDHKAEGRDTNGNKDPKSTPRPEVTDTKSASKIAPRETTSAPVRSTELTPNPGTITSHRCDPANLTESRAANKRSEGANPGDLDPVTTDSAHVTDVSSAVRAGCSGYDVKPGDVKPGDTALVVNSNKEDSNSNGKESCFKTVVTTLN